MEDCRTGLGAVYRLSVDFRGLALRHLLSGCAADLGYTGYAHYSVRVFELKIRELTVGRSIYCADRENLIQACKNPYREAIFMDFCAA